MILFAGAMGYANGDERYRKGSIAFSASSGSAAGAGRCTSAAGGNGRDFGLVEPWLALSRSGACAQRRSVRVDLPATGFDDKRCSGHIRDVERDGARHDAA